MPTTVAELSKTVASLLDEIINLKSVNATLQKEVEQHKSTIQGLRASRREMLASRALIGLVQLPGFSMKQTVVMALEYADRLITELELPIKRQHTVDKTNEDNMP